MIKTSKNAFAGWQNCQQISNGTVDLIICGEVGPRILFYGFVNGKNQFHVNPQEAGLTGGTQWRSYGGHRLWIAPEDSIRTYFPDNRNLSIATLPTGVCLTAPVEETTGFQKSITVEMDGTGAHIHVTHKLINQSNSPQDAAPWALTVLRPGGVAVLPIGSRCTWPEKLTAQNTLSLWGYTCMTDPRWTWGDEYILLRQDINITNPQKIAGDIYISVERIKENAEKFRQPFDTELARVMVHGILHLLGYKDKTARDREQMTRKEDYYLDRF